MERTRQKGRLKTANRGHKLLKDKSDEMIRSFLTLIKQNRALRERIERDLTDALRLFMSARAKMSSAEVDAAVEKIKVLPRFSCSTSNIMGVITPKIEILPANAEKHRFISTPAAFDRSLELLLDLTAMLLDLANIEKTCDMLASEIEKTRRRINSLEYIMIPNTKETIKYITMKLDEDQRSQQIRVMKVKQLQTQATGETFR
jgi:V/A-type H+-transporting ATPase subunit D